MTADHKARIMSAVAGRAVQPLPRGELLVDPGFAEAYLAWSGRSAEADRLRPVERVAACCLALGIDLVGMPAGAGAQAVRWLAGAGLAVFGIVDGAFEAQAARQGMMPLLMDIARAPDDAAAALGRRSEEATVRIRQAADAGVHGIIVADDIAYGEGPYMAPAVVDRVLVPLWRDQAAAARGCGLPVFFHSDGNLNAVLPQVVAAGFDGLQGVEPAAGMDITAVRAQVGAALCLMGNVDPALLLPPSPGTPDGDAALRAGVAAAVRAGGGGGLIFGTCSGLYADLPPAGVHRMYRLAAEMADA